MYKKPIIRAVICLIIILLARKIIISGIDHINVLSTNYINAKDNQIAIDDSFEGIYAINNPGYNNGVLDLVIDADNHTYTLFIRSLIFYHKIYLNDELYSQNIDKSIEGYNQDFAYKTLEIIDKTHIRIYGNELEQLEFFIAKKGVMDKAIESRTILYTITLVSLILVMTIFIIMFLYDNKEKYFLVFIFIGITSIIKSIALGELSVLSDILHVHISNYEIFDNVTTVINNILPITIMLNLYEIKISKRIYKFISIILLLILILLFIDFHKYYYSVLLVISSIGICLNLYAAAHKKTYYKIIIVLNTIIYFSLVAYKLNVMNGIYQTGILNYYMNTAYVGAIIYLIGFALIFINKYKTKIKESIKKEKEFERIILLRGISHDLKLPLSVIKISSQMIESEKLYDKQIKEYANDITQEVNTLEKMTDNINAYLKLGYKDEKKCDTNVKAIFKRIENDFNVINHDHKYDFCVLCDSKDYYLNVDEMELYRLLYNIVDNSFKYCDYNDQITISYKVEDRLRIIVEDTGVGIDSMQLSKIFSPFYRLDKSRAKEGLGLGLSVVKGIVDKYGGDITIESNLGRGTKVIIYL